MTEDKVYEIWKKMLAWDRGLWRRMSKKKWSDGIDIRRLSGDEWLRLLTGETNLGAFEGWCETCRTGSCQGNICKQCRAPLLKFDSHFWFRIDSKIRRAMQKDKSLLSRVKSERESLYGTKHKLQFPSPLEWLHNSWAQAPRPPHHAFDPRIPYLVANWIDSLSRLGLSQAEIVDVLSTAEFPDGLVKRRGKDYANLPGEDLRKLGEEFRQELGRVPSSAQDPSEMWRTIKWVDRQRAVPMARLQGERLRKRNPARSD